jgi:putative ABC transport system ATP-binding protein
MLHEGRDILDKAGDEKRALALNDVLGLFTQISVECGN